MSIINFLRLNTFAAAAFILWAQAGASQVEQQQKDTREKPVPQKVIQAPPLPKEAAVDQLVPQFYNMGPQSQARFYLLGGRCLKWEGEKNRVVYENGMLKNASDDLRVLQAYLDALPKHKIGTKNLETAAKDLVKAEDFLRRGFDTGYWFLHEGTTELKGEKIQVLWKHRAKYHDVARQVLDLLNKSQIEGMQAQKGVKQFEVDFNGNLPSKELEIAKIVLDLSAAEIDSALDGKFDNSDGVPRSKFFGVKTFYENLRNLGIPHIAPELKVLIPDAPKEAMGDKPNSLPNSKPPLPLDTWGADRQSRYIIAEYTAVLERLFDPAVKVIDPNTKTREVFISPPPPPPELPPLEIPSYGPALPDQKLTYMESGGWQITRVYYGAPDAENRYERAVSFIQLPNNTLYGAYSENSTLLVFRVSPTGTCTAYIQRDGGPWRIVPHSMDLSELIH